MTQQTRHQIRAGWLIDGSGGPIRKDQLLTIESGRIAAIEAAAGRAEAAGPLTDLSHGVVLPVLIDSHAHLCMSGTIDPELRQEQRDAPCEALLPLIAEHLRHHFSHGILAVRDGGDRSACVLRYLRHLHDPGTMPVRVVTPGPALHRRGRYGGLIGTAVADDETLLAAYRRLAPGTGPVKVVNSGLNSLTEFGRQSEAQFSAAELGALVEAAGQQGRSVMVHANGREPVRVALDAGCRSIEHGFFMGRENLERMADRGIFWVPTVYTMKGLALHAGLYHTEIDRAVVERTLDDQLAQLAYARQCGVKVALGTDSGSIGVLHGEALVEEMKLFIKAGFSLSETIQSATECGAGLLGLPELGRIEPGKPAHFLVTRGLPSQLPRKLGYLEAVYLDGRPSPIYRRDPDYTTLRKFEGVAFGGKVRY